MISIGDIVEGKPQFLIKYNVKYEHRFFKVKSIDGEYWHIDNGNGFDVTSQIYYKDFYIPTNVNREILKLISDEDVSIKEFNAVTVDGKIINFKSTR